MPGFSFFSSYLHYLLLNRNKSNKMYCDVAKYIRELGSTLCETFGCIRIAVENKIDLNITVSIDCLN